MAKLSISVPDDLWERARQETHLESPSELVQAALSQLLSSATRRQPIFIGEKPAGTNPAYFAAYMRLRQQARDAYERGYNDGLTLAQKLPWTLLDYLVELDFDFDEWNKGLATAEVSLGGEPIREFVDNWFAEVTFWGKGTTTYGRVYHSGLVRALGDLWNSVVSGQFHTKGEELREDALGDDASPEEGGDDAS